VKRARAAAVAGALALLLGFGVVGGCTLFDGDPPPERACSGNDECFQAQGERCELDAGVCVLIDAGASQ
jgi:hypothetical protein